MAKPQWGTKRTCRACGARFYDLKRKNVVCPKCDAPYDPDAASKPRRNPPAEPEPAPAEAPALAAEGEPETPKGTAKADGEDLKTFDDDDEKAKAEDILEDASELGEDEDDMADVIDGSRKNDEG